MNAYPHHEAIGRFDPELPTANAVWVSLSGVATQYASHPLAELAMLGLQLAQTLTAKECAENALITIASKPLQQQWMRLLDKQPLASKQQAFAELESAGASLQ